MKKGNGGKHMSKKLVRLATLTLGMAMLLSACGGGDTGTTTTTTKGDDVVTTTADTEGEDTTPDTTGPIYDNFDPLTPYDETVTLHLAVAGNQAQNWNPDTGNYSYGDNVWTQGWQEELNIKTEVVWTANNATGDYDTRLALQIAERVLPDVINFNTYAQFRQCLLADFLTDLTDIYEACASDRLKKNLEDGQMMHLGQSGGRLYALPSTATGLQAGFVILVRKAWFDELGMDKPETMEDVIAIAKAMKDKDPDNRFALPLGDTIMKGNTMGGFTGIANAFGAQPGIWFDKGNGNVVYGSVQPEFKPVVQMFADMVAEGYMDSEFATYDGMMLAEKMTGVGDNGQFGIAVCPDWMLGWPLLTIYNTTGIEWDIYPLMPSETLADGAMKLNKADGGQTFAVNANYDHPEIIFKLMEYSISKLDDKETADLDTFHTYTFPDGTTKESRFGMNPFGNKGTYPLQNFTTHKDVTAVIDGTMEESAMSPQAGDALKQVRTYFDWLENGDPEVRDGNQYGQFLNWYGPDSMFGVMVNYYESDMYISDVLSGYQTPTMVMSWAGMVSDERVAIDQFVGGQRPMTEWDDYVAEWEAAGGADITQEINDWYASK